MGGVGVANECQMLIDAASSHLKLFYVYANKLLCPLVLTMLEVMEKLSCRSNETRQNSILCLYVLSCNKFNCVYLPYFLPLFYFVTVVALIFSRAF